MELCYRCLWAVGLWCRCERIAGLWSRCWWMLGLICWCYQTIRCSICLFLTIGPIVCSLLVISKELYLGPLIWNCWWILNQLIQLWLWLIWFANFGWIFCHQICITMFCRSLLIRFGWRIIVRLVIWHSIICWNFLDIFLLKISSIFIPNIWRNF